jgi:hypothetical protein
MFVSKWARERIERFEQDLMTLRAEAWHRRGEQNRLEIENARLRADLDWFKHRLNQVERERGQLIQDRLGIKIAVPEFVPTYEDPASALNDQPNLSTVGHDADEESVAEPGDGVDYSLMPGYSGAKR